MKTDKKNWMYDWWLEVGITEAWSYQHELFNDKEIEKIRSIGDAGEIEDAVIGSGKKNRKDESFRSTDLCFFNSQDPENDWIYERITVATLQANERFWNFELNRIETLQYSIYNKGQFYKDHIDMMYHNPGRATRKLSFSLQLSDPKEYEGGDLLIKTSAEPNKVSNNKGTIIFFPSYHLHEVTPVTKGTRHGLVGWVSGPPFK